MTERVALVVGVGAGLGRALVHRFAEDGMVVAAVSRRGAVPDLGQLQHRVHAYAADVSVGEQVTGLYARVTAELGPPELVVFNVGTFDRAGILDISDALFTEAWRTGCFAGFLVGRAAAASMLAQGKGTLIFTGATASIRGSAGFAAFAVPKFGLRALTQSMARELGPKGVHVAHVIIDGMIDDGAGKGSGTALRPADIAEVYAHLHRQQRSAWTQELDLRPAGEKF